MKLTMPLILFLLSALPLLADQAPSFIIRDNKPMVQVAIVAPCLGLNVSMNPERTGISIDGRRLGNSFPLSDAVADDKSSGRIRRDVSIFPEYPGVLFISLSGVMDYEGYMFWDQRLNELVVVNPFNGNTLVLTGKEPAAPIPARPISETGLVADAVYVPWDIERLKALADRYPELLNDGGAMLLQQAAIYGDVKAITLLLDRGIAPDAVDGRHYSLQYPALWHAINRNQTEAALLLMARGANVEERLHPDPLLLEAVKHKNTVLATALLDHKVNVNTVFHDNTALGYAVLNLDVDMARLLVTRGADIEARAAEGKTPLLLALSRMAGSFNPSFQFMIPPGDIRRIVEYLLTAGADVTATDESGGNVLTYALSLIDYDLFTLLVSKGATCRTDGTNGTAMLVSLLASAVELHDLSTVFAPLKDIDSIQAEEATALAGFAQLNSTLQKKSEHDLPLLFAEVLQRGVNVKALDKVSMTPLHFAVQLPNLTYTKALLAAGANVNANTEEAGYPLHHAVMAYNVPAVALLLEKGARVNAVFKSMDGATAFHLLFQTYYGGNDQEKKATNHDAVLSIARWLLRYKARLNLRDTDWGGQVIHHAARIGYPDAVALLLDHGAGIEAGDNDRTTPLGIAAAAGETATVALLITRKAKLNARDQLGNTPLHYAIRSREVSVIKLLLEKDANVSTMNNDGITPLMLAAHCDNDTISFGGVREGEEFAPLYSPYEEWVTALAAELVQRGCKINDVDKKGWSALHHASFIGRNALARALIALGADVNARDKEGNTPLHVAINRDNANMVSILLQHGAEINACNTQGLSALDLAHRTSKRNAAAVLVNNGATAYKYPEMR